MFHLNFIIERSGHGSMKGFQKEDLCRKKQKKITKLNY